MKGAPGIPKSAEHRAKIKANHAHYWLGKTRGKIRLSMNCLFCESQFDIVPQRIKTAKFCSKNCMNLSRKGTRMPWISIANAGKTGERSAKWLGGKPNCSKCLRQLSQYNPKTTLCQNCHHYNQNGRRSPMYTEWRTNVFERDNYICQICGVRGVTLNADHIKPWALYPELRFDINNGRTLCIDCHKIITFKWKGRVSTRRI